MQCRSRERCIGYNLQTTVGCIQLLPPADISLCSVLLRTNVRIELFVYRLAVNAQIGAMVTVAVVLNRTTAIVFNCLERLRHLHLHSETEHRRYFCLRIYCHLLSNFNSSLVVDDVSQIQLSRYLFHIIVGIYYNLSVLAFPFERSQLQFRVLPYSIFMLQTCTHIIIGRSTPEVRSKCSALVHQFQTCYTVAAQVTAVFIEFHAEVFTVYNQIIPIVFLNLGNNGFYIDGFYVFQFKRRSLVSIQHELVFSYSISGRQYTFFLFQAISHVQEPLFALTNLTQVKLNLSCLVRCNVQVLDTSAANGFSVGQYNPLHVISRKIAEEVFVVDIDFALCKVGRCGPDVLIVVTYFIHVRIGHTIGVDKSVVAEVVVGSIETVEVASVSIDGYAIFTFPTYRLIDKVPNETTLQVRILADEVPIFLESALRVTHSVRIFTLYQRLRQIVALSVFFHMSVVGIHRTVNIGKFITMCLLVLYGTAGIFRLDPAIGSFEVRAEACFVTK